MTLDAAVVEQLIIDAFPTSGRPAAGTLHASIESDEAGPLLEADFAERGDWSSLDAAFLDQAPGGYASALSFLTDAAFRYFLPAYLVADLAGQLDRADPVFHLTFGLTDASRDQLINPSRYGDQTWWAAKSVKFDGFTLEQAAAIVAYLELRAARDEFDRDDIGEALANYWRERTSPPST